MTENTFTSMVTEIVDGIDTIVAHNKDGSNLWIDDANDQVDMESIMELAKVLMTCGMFVVENWSEMSKYFPEEVRELLSGVDLTVLIDNEE